MRVSPTTRTPSPPATQRAPAMKHVPPLERSFGGELRYSSPRGVDESELGLALGGQGRRGGDAGGDSVL